MNNKPTLNHHHQTALLYLYNNPNQPPFTGPNNKALTELRQMGYVKAQEFENWAGTGRIRAEWMLTKAGIDFVENEILRKCAACTGIGQTLLRGKCSICNGSGQVWISDEPQRHFEDCPQCAPKFEKTDANRLAEQLETIARLEKELEESEKRGSELAASYCDGVVGDEYGHTYCRYRVERDAVLARPSTAIAAAPTYQFQYREIGESDWTPCDFSRYLYCSKSPEMDTRVVEVTSQTSPAQAEQLEAERPAVVGYRSVESGMVYEQDYGLKDPEALTTVAECDSIVGELQAERDAALARVAELEGKLTDWVREGFRLNEALAVAKSRYGAPEGYALVPVRETEAMHDAVMALLYNGVARNGVARTDTQKLLDAYINAATNKESV
ncbi:DnaJ [Pseudomonas phage vB_PaeM_C1-14_Ab28]|uniref:DnaJ n=1 Tax=Pseudomonas phage vB_PaeM_C1-14_Ab28 TaxID=1548917 RepID=UPI0018C324C1|nr:DnaJ [Pseudomonas phage vB_PaeM_C1-14_Ab28]